MKVSARFKLAALVVAAVSLLAVMAEAAEADRLADILKRGYVEVATEPYFAPNEFIDPAKSGNDKYVGSDIEFAKYIANKLGVELRIVPLEFGAVLVGVAEGKYDLAISALAYTPARAEAMTLSKGYYFSKTNSGHGLLVRASDLATIKGPEDCADKVVVAQSGSLQELFVNTQIPKFKEFKRVSTTNDAFLMVQEKKADVCVTSKTTAELYIKANKDCGLALVPDFQFYQDEETLGTRIGMPKKDSAALEARINEIVDEVVSSGIYEKWYDEYSEYAAKLGL
ncbi:MAG: transporter substrate-binding domain-containing protein [Synergistaceae bacterium]|jgi:polar amino acid transport system substrate-binding protein|nr:transporter substrate-binding domain-containing protein [Synergistaceae bacterium]